MVISVNVLAGQQTLRVAVVDTGLDLRDPRFSGVLCPIGHKDFTGTTLKDLDGHGTGVAGLIKQYAHNARYCLIIVKYFVRGVSSKVAYEAALKHIEALKPDVVNISGGAENYLPLEQAIIERNPDIQFIVAAGNENKHASTYYPGAFGAFLNNVITVGALDGKEKAQFSNFAKFLYWRRGVDVKVLQPNGYFGIQSGTSQATAIYTGEYIHAKAR